MKKLTACLLAAALLAALCSCTKGVGQAGSGDERSAPSSSASADASEPEKVEEPEGMTLIRTNSPPVCKTTTDAETIRRVKELLDAAKKEVYTGEPKAGWSFKIDFSDGTSYAVAGDMLYAAPDDYTLSGAEAEALLGQLTALYDGLSEKETVYTKNPYVEEDPIDGGA